MITIDDLLAMPIKERLEAIRQAMDSAEKEEFETFEAYELYDDDSYNLFTGEWCDQ